MVDGRERASEAVTNSNVRRIVEQFHRMSAMRVTDPQHLPHMAFEPAPTDQDTPVQDPGLVLENIQASRIPANIAAIHHAQQASMRRRVDVRQQQTERQQQRQQRVQAATPTPTPAGHCTNTGPTQHTKHTHSTTTRLSTERDCAGPSAAYATASPNSHYLRLRHAHMSHLPDGICARRGSLEASVQSPISFTVLGRLCADTCA